MPAIRRPLFLLTAFAVFAIWPGPAPVKAAEGSSAAPHESALKAKDLNTPREFPPITSAKDWQARAKEIREHVLVSCGLWPLPGRTPLGARVFDKMERDDYSIEKVYFQTYPGFFLAGNLYRPLGKGKGPFPAVLNPHGHWGNGRMADERDGSIAARCISFARMGMIAFSYDMVGYNDTHFADPLSTNAQYNVHREFATNRADLLWNISLMGLQTWNSIRALDFLQSLPDADPKRLACTGESGGGTQTFILGSVDDRLALQAPIVMVSHTMQGGCLCENAPGLRVQFSNMEIAAAPAPRPQILVAATGDWTKDTLTVEGPSIANIYKLLGAPEKFHFTRFDFPHNYNQTTRETVYGWFNKCLLHAPSFAPIKEQPYRKEPDSDLRVFPDGHLPPGALTRDDFIQSLKRLHQAALNSLAPHDKTSLRKFKETLLPTWRHSLQIEPGLLARAERLIVNSKSLPVTDPAITAALVEVKRPLESSAIIAKYWAPRDLLAQRAPGLAIVSTPAVTAGDGGASSPGGIARDFLQRGMAVLQVQQFSSTEPANQFTDFYCTYNRTTLQSRVRDLVMLCSAASSVDPRQSIRFRVTLVGDGPAGFWSLMAAPAADAVVADCGGVNVEDEETLLAPDLFCPGLLAFGGAKTSALLAAPHPLLLHNLGSGFPGADIENGYSVAQAAAPLKCEKARVSNSDIVAWLGSLKH